MSALFLRGRFRCRRAAVFVRFFFGRDFDANERIAFCNFRSAVRNHRAAAPLDHGDERAGRKLQLAHLFARPRVIFADKLLEHAEIFAVFKLGRGGNEHVARTDGRIAVGDDDLLPAQQ